MINQEQLQELIDRVIICENIRDMYQEEGKRKKLMGPGKPKTVDEVPEARPVPVTVGGTQVARSVVPRATAQHTILTFVRLIRRSIVRIHIITLCIAVLRPLPYIAQHIMQLPVIGLKSVDRGCIGEIILAIKCFPAYIES